MTQATSYQVPAHPSGLDMRTQLNIIVAAILGDNAGPTAPTETYPGMMWGDTTANRLKRRTNTNDAWINIGPLDNFLGDIQGQISSATSSKVSKSGDTMTGGLTLPWASFTGLGAGGQIQLAQAQYGTILRNDNVNFYLLCTDSGNPNGVFNGLRPFSFGMASGVVTMGHGLIINAGGANITGRLNLRQSGAYGEAGFFSQDGTKMYLRGRNSGGGMEWINDAYNSVVATMDNGGSFTAIGFVRGATLYAGNAYLGSDGNVGGSGMPNGNLFSALANKANNGAQVQWNSGVWEFGAVSGGAANTTLVCGAPWVMVGIRTTTGPGWLYLQAVWLRNQ